jgi:hypothetical protein
MGLVGNRVGAVRLRSTGKLGWEIFLEGIRSPSVLENACALL